MGESIFLTKLKDIIVVPLLVSLGGKKMEDGFDFRIIDVVTREEIVGDVTRVRKMFYICDQNPAFFLSQQLQVYVKVLSRDLKSLSICTKTIIY